MPQEEAAEDIAYRILKDAKKAGAEVIVTLCPLCHRMLGHPAEGSGEEAWREDRDPCFVLTQLVGIALGWGRGSNLYSPKNSSLMWRFPDSIALKQILSLACVSYIDSPRMNHLVNYQS